MTYWAKEHQQNLYRISDMLRDIDAAYEHTIPALVEDLRQDDRLGTETAVGHLLEARSRFVDAQAELEKARAALPQPRFVTSIPSSVRASDLTAEEVMTHDG